MGVFSFAVGKNDTKLSKAEVSKDIDIFKYIWGIYDVIRSGNPSYREELDGVLGSVDPSKYGFIVWVLNHNLVYNKFTRENLELFTLVSNTFLNSEEYVRFCVDYMVKSGIKFPKFMPWHKIGVEQEDKRYKELIKEKFELNDDELEDVLEYLKGDGISIRDVCLSLL